MHRSQVLPHRLAALLAASLLLAAAGAALAQVDDRARELIEGLQTGEYADIRTLDQTMVATVHMGGAEQTMRTRTIVDYEARRAAIDTELAPGMAVRIVIEDGSARMVMGGMSMPVPPGMDAAYDGIFDRGPDLLAEGVSATYDGVHAYGDLVSGHQVTLRDAAGLPGLEGADEQRLVFDDDGRLIAVVAVVPEAGTMVSIPEEPQLGSPFIGSDATIYLLHDDGAAELFMTMRFEDVRVNEPIDPGAFD